MLRNEELMSGLIRFGQGNVHDFIVRSNDVNNALTYLWVEPGFDLARVSSFKAVNFVTFENNEVLRYTLYQAKNQGHQSTHSTPRSEARGMPFDKLKVPSTAEGLRVDTERRFQPRF